MGNRRHWYNVSKYKADAAQARGFQTRQKPNGKWQVLMTSTELYASSDWRD